MSARTIERELSERLAALAKECQRGGGFTSWLVGGGAQHTDIRDAVAVAQAKLQEAAAECPPKVPHATVCEVRRGSWLFARRQHALSRGVPQEVARPFLLACGVRQSALCALGLSSLQRLVAADALSPASTAALVAVLQKVRAPRIRAASRRS